MTHTTTDFYESSNHPNDELDTSNQDEISEGKIPSEVLTACSMFFRAGNTNEDGTILPEFDSGNTAEDVKDPDGFENLPIQSPSQ